MWPFTRRKKEQGKGTERPMARPGDDPGPGVADPLHPLNPLGPFGQAASDPGTIPPSFDPPAAPAFDPGPPAFDPGPAAFGGGAGDFGAGSSGAAGGFD